jgi:hypothetical protein
MGSTFTDSLGVAFLGAEVPRPAQLALIGAELAPHWKAIRCR